MGRTQYNLPNLTIVSDLCRFRDVTNTAAGGYSYDYNPCNTFKASHCKKKEVYVRFSTESESQMHVLHNMGIAT